MARRKNPLPARATGAAPNHDSLAMAIYAALTARPGGATTAIIADAAGIGRSAARAALAAMEVAGAVARTKGGKPGVPDIWAATIGLPHATTGQVAGQSSGGSAGRREHGARPATRDQVPGSDGRADVATPDPAVVTEITRRIEQILAAASDVGLVLAGGGNMSAVRAGLDEIWQQAAQARRVLKAAAAEKKAGQWTSSAAMKSTGFTGM